jgi:hypothetical protein
MQKVGVLILVQLSVFVQVGRFEATLVSLHELQISFVFGFLLFFLLISPYNNKTNN